MSNIKEHIKTLCDKYDPQDKKFVELVFNELVHDDFWKQTAFMQAEDLRAFIGEEKTRRS